MVLMLMFLRPLSLHNGAPLGHYLYSNSLKVIQEDVM